jgi:hypothetical protein
MANGMNSNSSPVSCFAAGIALTLLISVVGCSVCGDQPMATCNGSAAEVSLSAPAELDLGTTLLLSSFQSCLDIEGRCSLMPSFTLDTSGPQQGGVAPLPNKVLTLQVSFPQTAGGMTLTLPSSDVITSAFSGAKGLLAVSGTLGVEAVSAAGFRVSLQLELKSDDGQTFTVAGSVSASDCAVRQVRVDCSPG